MTTLYDVLLQAIDLQNKGRIDEAERLFRGILAIDANNIGSIYSLCVILLNRGQTDEALRLCSHGIEVAKDFAPIRLVHGGVLQALGHREEALKSYDEAIRLNPGYTEALINSGVLLRSMFRHKDALERFNSVLISTPDNELALANCGVILTEFHKRVDAISMFRRLLAINPNYDYGLGLLCMEQLHVCDWSNVDILTHHILEGVRAGRRVCKTLALMAIADQASDHYAAARIFSQHHFPKNDHSFWTGERYQHKKIRVAYVSPDLREHPVGHLMVGVLEKHDKSRFETIAISLGIDDQSRIRARMIEAFDHFIDARHMGTVQIAQTMREMEVDIAIDLAGYTADTGLGAFAYRPAPIQVNYLGYPGTSGSSYIDYIIADRHLIPEEHKKFYSEKVVYMPDTYMPVDDSIAISQKPVSRADYELPEDGVVFCSFSHDYKISPHIFEIWMRILKQVPGSVLWLMSRDETSEQNLRQAAEARDVSSSRLIFAKRVPLVEDHLARYRLADMFLDTHPYNAHTTAADALMAGLPVITYLGNAFAARVAASLLHAAGMSRLVTRSFADYENLAIELATNKAALADVKASLQENIAAHPLCDTTKFCRNLEAIYIAMWRRYQLGDFPDDLG
jgi:predicted O-linked N-acetylglucosamine transferase (SPINDLY family)